MNEIKNSIDAVKELANIHSPEIIVTETEITNFIKEGIRESFYSKFPGEDFDASWERYKQIVPFPALGNIYDYSSTGIDKKTHYLIRLVATWHIEKALIALKYDVNNDANLLKEEESGNIGTAGRIAKIWAGNGLDSENIREYADGRWTKPPRLATFPAKENESRKPVTVVIENTGIGSVCSHHFLPYSIQPVPASKIVISYIPNKKLLGLSKIGRFVEWCLNRPSLQEEVTELIFSKIKEIAETEDVYVGLFNLQHTCEVTRGAKQHSTTTTEEYSGAYTSTDLRDSILR